MTKPMTVRELTLALARQPDNGVVTLESEYQRHDDETGNAVYTCSVVVNGELAIAWDDDSE